MKSRINLLKFSWLLDENEPELEYITPSEDIGWIEYPFPDGSGSGGFEEFRLEMGMSFFHAKHHFTKDAPEGFIPLAEVEAELNETSLQMQSVRGGRLLHMENGTITEIKPGWDLFRYNQSFKVTPMLDTGKDSEFFSLTIPESTLISLLGKDVFENLLSLIGIATCPSIKTLSIPPHISKQLHNCLSAPSIRGELKSLYIQIRALEYLNAMLDYLLKDHELALPKDKLLSEDEIQKIYHYLTNLNGKLPKLDEISSLFNYSARALNESFKAHYKETIYCVINNARLENARHAIINSDVPLKVLSTNLGYSHVNHFNHAFRKKYGYPPGSLRH